MTESPVAREADGTSESASAELGDPTSLDEVGEEEVGSVPDLDARERRIRSERRAPGPALLPPETAEQERGVPESESLPTDPD